MCSVNKCACLPCILIFHRMMVQSIPCLLLAGYTEERHNRSWSNQALTCALNLSPLSLSHWVSCVALFSRLPHRRTGLHDRLGEKAFENPYVEIVHQETNGKLFGEHLCTTARLCLSRHIIYLGFFHHLGSVVVLKPSLFTDGHLKIGHTEMLMWCTAMGIQEVAAGTPRGPLSAEEDKAFRESIVLLWDVSQVCLETSWLMHICIFAYLGRQIIVGCTRL
jgi:hypothetical protein